MRPATVQGMRALALWAVLFAAYAATLGVDAVGRSDYGGDEPRYLLVAESMVSDRDIDLTDEFASRAYADFHDGPLERQGRVILGRSMEPQGIGFALLIAPAYALGGATAVELFLAAITALGFVLAAAIGRRMVPEPWASGAALLVGLSPLALAHATAVYPEAAAGTALAGAALCALRVREHPAFGSAVVGAALLAALPWLGPKYLLPAAPIAFALVRWTARRGRRTAALAAAEIMVASVVVYATINDRLFGGLTPYAASASGDRRRRGLGLGARRAPAAAGRAVDRPRRRAAALAPVLVLSRVRGLAAVALAARTPGAAGRGARRRRSRRGARALGLGRRAARGGVRRAVDRAASGSRAARSLPGCRWRRRCAPGACATRRAPARCLGASRCSRRYGSRSCSRSAARAGGPTTGRMRRWGRRWSCCRGRGSVGFAVVARCSPWLWWRWWRGRRGGNES